MNNLMFTVAVGVMSAIIAATTSLYISRKSKYLEIVTAERIKWIGIVRGDLAKLTNYMIIYQKARAKYAQSYNDTRSCIDLISDERRQSQKNDVYDLRQHENDTENNRRILEELSHGNEIIELACLLKLRFNPVDDADIILLLNKLIKYVSEVEPSTKDVEINHIVDCSQAVLKREWEKVKSETNKWLIA